MNEFKFDTIEVGFENSFVVKVSEEMLSMFKQMSGDENPMHIDDEYAQKYGFDSKIVYGMLTASFYSKLAGMYIPGKYCILKSVETFFQNPVYVGDELVVKGIVKDKDERFRQIVVKAKIINSRGKTVSKANIIAGFYE